MDKKYNITTKFKNGRECRAILNCTDAEADTFAWNVLGDGIKVKDDNIWIFYSPSEIKEVHVEVTE